MTLAKAVAEINKAFDEKLKELENKVYAMKDFQTPRHLQSQVVADEDAYTTLKIRKRQFGDMATSLGATPDIL